MALPFSPADLKAFRAYVKVQESGHYNMLDPRAAHAAGLNTDQMVFIMSNYNELKSANREAEADDAKS